MVDIKIYTGMLIIYTLFLSTWVGNLCTAELTYHKLRLNIENTSNVPEYEIETLYDLYNATQGNEWQWSSSTKSGNPWQFTADANPCADDWLGVTCSSTPVSGYLHVMKLNLEHLNLVGYVPESIGNLTELTELSLFNNYLNSTIPQSIGTLQNLSYLNLDTNQFHNKIPDLFIELNKLTYLDFGNNKLTGPISTVLCELSALTQLRLFANKFTGTIPHCLGQLTELTALLLYTNYLHGTIPSFLGNLTQLQELYLRSNKLTGSLPSALRTLIQLNNLDVSYNYLTGTIPEYITTFTKMEYLVFNMNYMYGTLPTTIGNLTLLQEFSANHNYLNGTIPSSLQYCIALKSLVLEYNDLTGTIPADLGNMVDLQVLVLYNNNLSGSLPASLGGLTDLWLLFMSNNYLTGIIPESFQNLSSISKIMLNKNHLSGPVPYQLLDLSSLTIVELSQNKLSGLFPEPVDNWSNLLAVSCAQNYLSGPFPVGFTGSTLLLYLNLSSNQFTSTIPMSMFTLSRLGLLYLGGNLLSGQIPDVSEGLEELSYLFLDSNLLTGTIPVSLGSARLLQSVNLSSNHLSGTIPTSLSQLTDLVVLLLQDNALSGNIDSIFDVKLQVKLTTVQLSDNQLTGTLPDAIGELADLQVFAVVSNCFTGSLPESLCDSSSLVTLALDGMQSAPVCQQRLFPATLEGSIVAQSLYSIRSPITGGIPECLFRMANLTTLHLSGNGLTGSLSSNITISSYLLDLSLSHNKLEGRIPSAVLQRQWNTLDLSYNRFTGTLEDNTLSQYPSSTSIYLDNNRLSGEVPDGFLHLATVDVLQSNLFSCRDDKSDLPQHDPNLDKYECGSVVLDDTLYAWIAIFMCVSVLMVTVLYWQSARCKQWGMVTCQQVQCWWTAVNTEVPKLQQLFFLLGMLVETAVLCAIYTLLVLLPVYTVGSALSGTYTYQYAWSLSAAYLSGEASFAAEAVCLLGLMLLAIVGLRVLLSRTPCLNSATNAPRNNDKDPDDAVEVASTKIATYHWYVLFFVVTVLNFTVVLGVNIAYVIIALSQSGKALTATQTALAVFKVTFNSGCSPMLLRWASQRFLGAQVSALGFVSVQLIVSIVNNIFIPCLVVAIISPSCFYNIFESANGVTSSYTYQGKCIDVDPYSVNLLKCIEQETVTARTSYNPPFSYSYQCSSSFVTYYAPAFVIMCILAGFGIPLGQVMLQRLHSRAVVGTRWFGLLDLVLPRVLKPVQENPARSEYMFFNNAGQQLVTVLTYLGLLLTFGAVFPPLALCLAVTMLSITMFARLKVGRLLVQAREEGRAEEYARILEQECADVNTDSGGTALVTRAVRGICCFACGFYTLFLFDTLGDAQGLSGAYWVLIVCPTVLPVLLGLRELHTWWYWRHSSAAEGDSNIDNRDECTELTAVTMTTTKSPMVKESVA